MVSEFINILDGKSGSRPINGHLSASALRFPRMFLKDVLPEIWITGHARKERAPRYSLLWYYFVAKGHDSLKAFILLYETFQM